MIPEPDPLGIVLILLRSCGTTRLEGLTMEPRACCLPDRDWHEVACEMFLIEGFCTIAVSDSVSTDFSLDLTTIRSSSSISVEGRAPQGDQLCNIQVHSAIKSDVLNGRHQSIAKCVM